MPASGREPGAGRPLRFLLPVLLLVPLPLLGGGGEDDPEARAVLERAEARYDSLASLRAGFSQVIEVPLLNRRREGRGTWYQEGRARFRLDFEEPEGDLIVADGRHLWLYYPSTHPGQVIRARLEAHPTGTEMLDLQGRIFREASTRYEATYGGRGEVDGAPVHEVRLEPRETGSPYRRVRVWVDVRSYLVRRFEITEVNETVRTLTLRDLEPDVPLPDCLFRFEPPEGVEVFEG